MRLSYNFFFAGGFNVKQILDWKTYTDTKPPACRFCLQETSLPPSRRH